MAAPIDLLAAAPTDSDVVRIAIAIALGLFLGLEREWSQKAAGIRTFALTSVLGAIFMIVDRGGAVGEATGGPLPVLTAAGALFTTVLAGVLMFSGLRGGDDGSLHLTTGVSLLVAYGIGVLAGVGMVLPATVVAVASSLLLVFKRELHGLAWGLSREELRSATEFAIIAFVVYPLLPAGSVSVGTNELSIPIEPRVVWLMVVFVAAIGVVNYGVVRTYGSRGIAVTGFFGGLASSTAVVGTMLDHVRQQPEARHYAVAAILLADAAMAVRNLLVALVFTSSGSPLLRVIVPLGALVLASVVLAVLTADWRAEGVAMDLETPFSLRNALAFGALFLLVVLAGGLAEVALGRIGFYATAVVTGLVSSAGATTSAVVLYRGGSLSADGALIAIVLATMASVAVKAALVVQAEDRAFITRVVGWSALLITVAAGGGALVVL
ncbi:MAG: MgtC/SapB family protein [Halobacteriaceae archaeon]